MHVRSQRGHIDSGIAHSSFELEMRTQILIQVVIGQGAV